MRVIILLLLFVYTNCTIGQIELVNPPAQNNQDEYILISTQEAQESYLVSKCGDIIKNGNIQLTILVIGNSLMTASYLMPILLMTSYGYIN